MNSDIFAECDAESRDSVRLLQMSAINQSQRVASPSARSGRRVGFLFNHDEIHQVAHTAPVISALQAIAPELRVDVLTSSETQHRAVLAHLDPAIDPPAFYPLSNSPLAELFERTLGGLIPLGRIGKLSANLNLLRKFDALVVPETTSILLKTRYGLDHTKLIFLPHGAGDRSISVSPTIGEFDFVLLPGDKTRERMLAENVVRPGDHAVIGYPKFESPHLASAQQFFDNDRPVVLYNPHFDPRLSSWFSFGEDLLDYFLEQDRYNLIFAPHVMLFRRRILASAEHARIRIRQKLPKRFLDVPHILIDTGSPRSVDMSYTRSADIYIGDVSSQIYEFIERPRPAIFLNSHEAQWRDNPNYEFWHFGPVVSDIPRLATALKKALPFGNAFRKRQTNAFQRTFSLVAGRSSAERAASAISEYLARSFNEGGT